jgi:hypothetical protein
MKKKKANLPQQSYGARWESGSAMLTVPKKGEPKRWII